MAIPTVYDPNKMMSVAKIAGSKSPTASPTPKPVIPMSAEVAARETANKQQTAQAWINNPNSGQGGLDAYTAKQNERYAGALSANDTDLTNRLTADAQRVGYTLNAPKPPENMPVAANNAYQPPDYAALAAARFTASLAQKQSIANQQKSSADTAFRQQTQRTNDNRILQDFSRTQTANPFGNMGRKSFQEGLIGRERTQADADAAASLQTQKANIDQLLADYQNASADEQLVIADQLKKADQEYQLNLAQLTGQINGQSTLAKIGQDAQYTGVYNGQQTLQSQQLSNDNAYRDKTFDYGVGQDAIKNDQWDKSFNYNVAVDSRDFDYKKAQDAWNQTFQKQQYNDQKAAQLWEQTFKTKSFQQDMANAAASRGLQWASLNQRDKEFIADSAYREKTYNAQQAQQGVENGLNRDKLDWEKSSANPSNIPKTATTSFKDDPDFKADAANMVKAPLAAREELRNNAQAYIEKYGMDGYNSLISVVNR